VLFVRPDITPVVLFEGIQSVDFRVAREDGGGIVDFGNDPNGGLHGL